jgi:hypothetical protein
MSSSGSRALEAWLVLVGMLAGTAWYAWPQLGHTIQLLRSLIQLLFPFALE